MTGPWNDFNSAQSNTNVIPKGTIAKVRLTLRPGGFDDASQGWTGGWARRATTGAVYLDAEYTVLEGPYARRKIWSLIGLYSPKGPEWGNMGRGLVRGMLNSARGVSDKDNSPEAQLRRRINDLRIDEDARFLLGRLVVMVVPVVVARFRLRIRVFRLQVDHQQPLGHADLDRGEADAGGIVHRLEHVFDQRAQIVVELVRFDRGRDGFQPGVRHFEDFTDSHRAHLGAVGPSCKRQSTGLRARKACASVPSSR